MFKKKFSDQFGRQTSLEMSISSFSLVYQSARLYTLDAACSTCTRRSPPLSQNVKSILDSPGNVPCTKIYFRTLLSFITTDDLVCDGELSQLRFNILKILTPLLSQIIYKVFSRIVLYRSETLRNGRATRDHQI